MQFGGPGGEAAGMPLAGLSCSFLLLPQSLDVLILDKKYSFLKIHLFWYICIYLHIAILDTLFQ